MPKREKLRTYAGILVLALPSVAFLLFYFLRPIDNEVLEPDSASYLSFSPFRTGGYPAFLKILAPLINTPADYIPYQLALYAVSSFLFCLAVWRRLDAFLAAALAGPILLANDRVNIFHFRILTDSLFVSLLLLFMAAAIYALTSPRLRTLAIASLLAGLLIAVRPIGIAILPALLVLTLAVRSRHRIVPLLVATVLPCLAVTALESGYYHAQHGPERKSLFYIVALGKAGMVTVPDAQGLIAAAPPERRALDQALETELATVRRIVDGAPNLGSLCRLLDNYEVFIQYGFLRAASITEIAAVVEQASMARLKAAPAAYARNAFQHWICLWTLWGSATGADLQALQAYLAAFDPLPYISPTATQAGLQLPRLAAYLTFAGILLIGVTTTMTGLLALLAVFGLRVPPPLLISGLAGLIVHAAFVVTAATAVSIPRYIFDFWPVLVIGIGMAGYWPVDYVLRRNRM